MLNLVCQLVRDAFLNAFDVSVIVTNDTDLIEPIKIVRGETGKTVGLLSPVIQQQRLAAYPSLVAVTSCTPHSSLKWTEPRRSITPSVGTGAKASSDVRR